MDEEKVISTGERSGGERHSDGHHRHSSRHRHRSGGEGLEHKRESWRKPRKRKIWLKRFASAAFAILSVIAVLLMLYVAYIYMN